MIRVVRNGHAVTLRALQVTRDPNATTQADIERLRAVGLGDREIFEATAWIAFRLAVSTVNDTIDDGRILAAR